MKQEIIDELNRLYSIEKRLNDLLEELSSVIEHKKGGRPFKEIYEDIIYKYLFSKDKE